MNAKKLFESLEHCHSLYVVEEILHDCGSDAAIIYGAILEACIVRKLDGTFYINDDWVCVTSADILARTGISRYRQENAIKKLCSDEWIDYELRQVGSNTKRHFILNLEMLG